MPEGATKGKQGVREVSGPLCNFWREDPVTPTCRLGKVPVHLASRGPDFEFPASFWDAVEPWLRQRWTPKEGTEHNPEGFYLSPRSFRCTSLRSSFWGRVETDNKAGMYPGSFGALCHTLSFLVTLPCSLNPAAAKVNAQAFRDAVGFQLPRRSTYICRFLSGGGGVLFSEVGFAWTLGF